MLPLSKRFASYGDDIHKWKEQFVNKRPAPIQAPIPGILVFWINGEAVRDIYNSDYSQGGNGARYPWIPNNEVWVEERFVGKELLYVVTHECEELVRMRNGMSYGDAHDEAKAIEDKMRHGDVVKSEQEQLGMHEQDPVYHGKTERDRLSRREVV